MSKWQPIDTAPKDGTDIVLVKEDDPDAEAEFAIGQWFVAGWCFMSTPIGDLPALIGFTPTHWMPLPEPPEDV